MVVAVAAATGLSDVAMVAGFVTDATVGLESVEDEGEGPPSGVVTACIVVFIYKREAVHEGSCRSGVPFVRNGAVMEHVWKSVVNKKTREYQEVDLLQRHSRSRSNPRYMD